MPATSAHPPATLIVEESPERLVLSLPAPRRLVTMLLLSLGLVAWLAIFISSAGAILASVSGGIMTGIVLLLWLTGWLLPGAVALYTLLWMTSGREIITLDGVTLTLRRDVKGHGRDQSYKVRHLEELRILPDPFDLYEFATSLRPFGIGGGTIAFDYLTQTIRFGGGLDADSAHFVCARLRQQLRAEAVPPQL